jgi:hypothetical protein
MWRAGSNCKVPGLGPTVRQQLATLRHLFDWLVTRQVVPVSPAASIRGPSHVLRSGKTAVLEVINVQFKRRLFLGPSAFFITLQLGRFQVADEIEGGGLMAPIQLSLPHEEVSAATSTFPNRGSKRWAAEYIHVNRPSVTSSER